MKQILSLITLIAVLFTSCSDDSDDDNRSSENELLKFEVEGVKTKIEDNTIYVYFEAVEKEFTYPIFLTVSENARAYFVKDNDNIQYAVSNGDTFNFSEGYNTLRVQAKDMSTQDYKIEIVQADGFSSMRIEIYGVWNGKPISIEGIVEGDIDEENKEVTFIVPFEYAQDFRRVMMFRTTYTGDKDYITVPNKNDFLNLSSFKEIYILDNVSQEMVKYSVVILNSDAFIKTIELPLANVFLKSSTAWIGNMSDYDYNKGLGRNDHIAFALENENIVNISPISITMTPNSTISPDENQSRDFTEDVKYMGTSESGVQHEIIVRVIKRKVLVSPYTGLQHVINGLNGTIEYVAISPIVSGVLVNTKTKEEYPMENFTNNGSSTSNPRATKASFVMKNVLPAGESATDMLYIPRVTLENGDITDVDIQFYSKMNRFDKN